MIIKHRIIVHTLGAAFNRRQFLTDNEINDSVVVNLRRNRQDDTGVAVLNVGGGNTRAADRLPLLDRNLRADLNLALLVVNHGERGSGEQLHIVIDGDRL